MNKFYGILVPGAVLALLFTAQPLYAQGEMTQQTASLQDEADRIQQEMDVNSLAEAFVIPDQYAVGQVEKVVDREEIQDVTIRLKNGTEKEKIVQIEYGKTVEIGHENRLKKGDEVIVGRGDLGGKPVYSVVDRYRMPALGYIAAIFLAVAIFFGKKRGMTSILGLILTFVILIQFIIPMIVAGGDPFWISLFGATAIAVISLYLAHGFNKRTSVALIGTIITLVLAAIMSILFVDMARLTGMGSEDAYFLQLGQYGAINLRGLLLGGIIIGALGILDDITTGQSAAVEEIHRANPKFSMKELYKRGLSVGREHIASLINTLVLAYAGASFPLFIIFSGKSPEPMWVTFNHEYLVEEIIRALIGSTTLIVAVPITTWLAARAFSKHKTTKHA